MRAKDTVIEALKNYQIWEFISTNSNRIKEEISADESKIAQRLGRKHTGKCQDFYRNETVWNLSWLVGSNCGGSTYQHN
jgi:hypothetical protein